MIVSGAESCCGVKYTSNAWAPAVVVDSAELERDVQHSTLDDNRESLAVRLGLQHLCIVHEDDGFTRVWHQQKL